MAKTMTKQEKILGIIIDCRLNFNNHIKKICRNACQKVSALSRIASNLTMIEEDFCLILWLDHNLVTSHQFRHFVQENETTY